jgi:hypothetical protein
MTFAYENHVWHISSAQKNYQIWHFTTGNSVIFMPCIKFWVHVDCSLWKENFLILYSDFIADFLIDNFPLPWLKFIFLNFFFIFIHFFMMIQDYLQILHPSVSDFYFFLKISNSLLLLRQTLFPYTIF